MNIMSSFEEQLNKEASIAESNKTDLDTSKDTQDKIKNEMLKSLSVLVGNFYKDVVNEKIKADNIKDAKDIATIYASMLGLGTEDTETPQLPKGARNILTQNNTIINNNGGKPIDLDNNDEVTQAFEKLSSSDVQDLINKQQVEKNRENSEEV